MQKSTEAKSETVETIWRKHAEARSETAGRWNNVLVIPYGEDSFAEVEDQISKMFIIEFGEFGTFITKDAHWTPPLALPDATDPMYEGYTNAQLKVAGDEAVKGRDKTGCKAEGVSWEGIWTPDIEAEQRWRRGGESTWRLWCCRDRYGSTVVVGSDQGYTLSQI